ncbi:MAG TPA: glucosidase, partial [Pirellulales bacterium]|nr:glucosidase [Pirellulales bacterium]
PQDEFPYAQLRDENRRRGRNEPEFELIDTGVFDADRYFDVFVEYAKATPNETLMQISVHNRGAERATLHLLPQLWFRNTWSWRPAQRLKPQIAAVDNRKLLANHRGLGEYYWYASGPATPLFCENDTNTSRLFGVGPAEGYFKDALDDYVVHGDRSAVNPRRQGTKAAFHYVLNVAPGGCEQIRVRLSERSFPDAFNDFEEIIDLRRREAGDFYASLQHDLADDDARRVQRQALAGMIWNKQFYLYDIPRWLAGDPLQPAPAPERRRGRNHEWTHLNNADVISMPDKWEYPWYAAWDLAFHCIPLSLIDAEFAKEQLILLTREWYMHPNGQLPAYEWALADVNPPVHAWAAWRVFQIDRKQRGDGGDLKFLERILHKLLINFTWWVNRKDAEGRNVFQGGFLGLDNIGVFDRSRPLPSGGRLDQADATAWMAMYCLNLMRISLELALHNSAYEDIATKFFEHFLGIAQAMTNIGDAGLALWDETDQFYYDKLIADSGEVIALRVRSIVGLIPLFAVETLEPEMLARLPGFERRLNWYFKHRPELAALVSRWEEPGLGERRLLSLLRGSRMKKLLRRMLDEAEFLSDFGIRSMSRAHAETPFSMTCHGSELSVSYEPGDSRSSTFGGNSNWRGPVWMPVNYLLIESLQKFHHYYGDSFKVECPTGSGRMVAINEVAQELTRRLSRIFLRDEQGRRAVFGAHEKLQNDPHFRDYLLFYEFFHGNDGRGLGASHQLGWTGLIAKLLQPRREEQRSCPLNANENAELALNDART